MKILHLESYNYSKESLKLLENSFNLVSIEFKSQKDLNMHLEKNQYDIIFTRLGLSINKEIIKLQKKLKFIVTPTTGLNHIDFEYAKTRDVNVISLKGETEFLMSVRSTAEHTWGLLLSAVRNIPRAFDQVKKNLWDRSKLYAYELDSKTIGIIGYGRLGKIVSGYAHAFNMNIIINDIRNISNETLYDEKTVDIDFLLENSDVICLMINYEESNIDFMDKLKFLKMKKNSIFINTARGELVNEDALLFSLENKKIYFAATDVLKEDSIWNSKSKISSKLIEYSKLNNNLIITPHIGGYGDLSIKRTRDFITNKFLKIIKNETNNYS